MQLYKTLFFAARQGHGATEVQAASTTLAIHYLQVADQVPRAAPTVTVPHSFSMPAGILTGPLKPVSNCERLHLSPLRPSRPNSPERAGGPVREWCQLKPRARGPLSFLFSLLQLHCVHWQQVPKAKLSIHLSGLLSLHH